MKSYKKVEEKKLKEAILDSNISSFSDNLIRLNEQGWAKILKHGDLPRWGSGFHALPDVTPSYIDLNTDCIQIGSMDDCSQSHDKIKAALKKMHPWRKGPFDIFGVHIDTEWHSDWKWDRIKDHISPLKDRTILDVGCGSGYHMWRMLGAGAGLVIGIDPTPLFSLHFATVKRYTPDSNAFIIPVGIDDMPEKMAGFDSVFSMGILYHRRSPIDHLIQLRELLCPGGELVLETLIIEGNETSCLIPEGRYAKMRNIWFIPSVEMLKTWIKRAGFENIRCVDVNTTTTDEQRSTEWMQFESLANFLDTNDTSKTIEGYPAPVRGTIIASKMS